MIANRSCSESEISFGSGAGFSTGLKQREVYFNSPVPPLSYRCMKISAIRGDSL